MKRPHEQHRLLLNSFTTLELIDELGARIGAQIVREEPDGIDAEELVDETQRRMGTLFELEDDDLPPPVPWTA